MESVNHLVFLVTYSTKVDAYITIVRTYHLWQYNFISPDRYLRSYPNQLNSLC